MRILPVAFEKADSRQHRRLEDAQPLFFEDDVKERLLDGDRTMTHASLELGRSGLTFFSHLDNCLVAQSARALQTQVPPLLRDLRPAESPEHR